MLVSMSAIRVVDVTAILPVCAVCYVMCVFLTSAVCNLSWLFVLLCKILCIIIKKVS